MKTSGYPTLTSSWPSFGDKGLRPDIPGRLEQLEEIRAWANSERTLLGA